MDVFDYSHTPLDTGRLIALEASAGSGKTFTIQKLVARLLMSENIPAEEIVVVTFTKSAAAELRARIRKNLLDELREAQERNPAGEDVKKLRLFLANFSHLRISTIHGFAQRTLAALGEPVGNLVPGLNSDEFRFSLRADVLRGLSPADVRLMSELDNFDEWLDDTIRVMMSNPGADIVATDEEPESLFIANVAREIRRVLAVRKRQLGVAGYDDLLTRLATRLRHDDDRNLVASSISALLIDEFQDTDALQWECFQRIAAYGRLKAFVVVGDPKQAIYGFRGGDVQVYQEAVQDADRYSLVTNWRSTTNFVEAENLFLRDYEQPERATHSQGVVSFGVNFDGTEVLGGEVTKAEIYYAPVTAAGPMSLAAANTPSWRFRFTGATKAAAIRRNVFDDIPRVVTNLLHEEIPDVSRLEDNPSARRPVALDDIVVLVATNKHGNRVAESLERAGIPTTVLGGLNVFASHAARQWRYLLNALDTPSETSSVRLFAQTWFGGATRVDLATHRDDDAWLATFQQQLLNWRSLFIEHRDVFFDTVIDESNVLIHLTDLARAERNITDVLHVAEVLRTRSGESISQLSLFLENASGTNEDEGADAEAATMVWARRVDSDQRTVRIMTIHKSKGLEFPIVLLPYLSDHVLTHSRAATYRIARDGQRETILDVAVTGAKKVGFKIKKQLAAAETRRRGYVAVTRAQVMNVMWTWNKGRGSGMLFREADDLYALAEENPTRIEIQNIAHDDRRDGLPDFRDVTPPRVLGAVARPLSVASRQLSYTALSTRLHSSGPVIQQESDTEPEGSEGGLTTGPSQEFFDIASSAQIGRVVHHVMQYLDMTAPRRTELIYELLSSAVMSEGMSAAQFPFDDAAALVARAISTRVGPIAGGLTLADFPPHRILPEMGFDFVVPRPQSMSGLTTILRRHLSDHTLLAPWVENLIVDEATLFGYMTGSIDAVLAFEHEAGPRFTVVDYKTNRLRNGSGDEEYSAATMNSAMIHHNYYLQAIFYVVALHRYLRSRLPDYRYSEHIAGAAYLFVRGMEPSQPESGVVSLQVPEALVDDLSEFFEGSRS